MVVVQPEPLHESAFPKVCRSCGHRYRDEFDFFAETRPVAHARSDVRAVRDDPEEGSDIYLEVYRNCACGSTLMERFHSRRDLSPAGTRRRHAFEKMLEILQRGGFPRDEARLVLLSFIDEVCPPSAEL